MPLWVVGKGKGGVGEGTGLFLAFADIVRQGAVSFVGSGAAWVASGVLALVVTDPMTGPGPVYFALYVVAP